MSSEIYVLVMGTFLGALFSSIGYLYKRRGDKKKVVNQSLFSLLEIWLQINRIVNFDPDKIMVGIKKFMAKKGLDISPDNNIQASFIIALKLLKRTLIEKDLTQSNEKLEALFNQTIKEISLDSPILAYQLNRGHSIQGILSFIDDYIKSLSESIEQNPPKILAYLGKQ